MDEILCLVNVKQDSGHKRPISANLPTFLKKWTLKHETSDRGTNPRQSIAGVDSPVLAGESKCTLQWHTWGILLRSTVGSSRTLPSSPPSHTLHLFRLR